MTSPKDWTRALARRLGFFDPLRTYAAEVVEIERRVVRVQNKVTKLAAMVETMDARLLEQRAEMARLHYGARKAARHGSEPRALRLLSDKRQAESRVRDLEEEAAAGRRLLKQASRQRDALTESLDNLRRAFHSAQIIRLAGDVARESRPPAIAGRLEEARRALQRAEALAELEAPEDDPFADLPELSDPEDRLLVARWRTEDHAQAA
ncbi:MAG: hypothetical protein AAFN74_04545 [Myxococcota bacterium]